MTTKRDAEYLADSRMVQPKATKETAQVNTMLGLSSSRKLTYTRGAARLYKIAIQRVRVKKWQTDPVEDGIGVFNPRDMARKAGLSLEKAMQYFYLFVKDNLMKIHKGTGFKGKDQHSVTPSRLLDFPEVPRTIAKTPAARAQEYRARKKAELADLKAKVAQLESQGVPQ